MPIAPSGPPVAPHPAGEVGTTGPAQAWYETVVATALLAFVALGLVGLVAAIAGVARPVVVAPLGLAAAAGLVALWRPDRPHWPRRPGGVPAWVIGAGILVILASTGWNARHTGQHIRTDRDQAIYLNGGKWIAEQGTLVVEGRGPGLDGVPRLLTNAFGQQVGTGDTDAELEIQAPHLLHTYLAQATWMGGNRALFAAPVLIGALALAAFFLLALRLVPGPLALVALAGLAANFIWLYAVRDPLAEPLLLLSTFGGAWFLDLALESGRWPRLFAAGLVVGTGFTIRLDAGIGIAMVLVVTGLVAARRARTRHRAQITGRRPPDTGVAGWAMILAVFAGVAVPAAIGMADTALHNTYYLRHHEGSLAPLVALVAVAAALALGVVGAERWQRRRDAPSSGSTAQNRRSRLAGLAAGAVVLAGVGAWFAWPALTLADTEWPDRERASIEAIQVQEGSEPDGNRSYAEGAVRRLGWYMGGPAVALGIAGLALAAHRIVAGRARTAELLLVAVAVPATVLYIWRPSIYPDQPWMMRRYLPHVVPGLLLFGALAAAAAGRALAGLRPRTPWARVAPAAVAVLAAVVVVGGTLPVTVPLRADRTQAGGRDGIERLCTTMGPDATVVMANSALVGVTLLPAVRSFCGVPAARAVPDRPALLPLEELVPAVEEAGRTLWVVAHDRDILEVAAPTAVDVQPVTLMETSALVSTVSRPPSEHRPFAVTVWVGRVERAA